MSEANEKKVAIVTGAGRGIGRAISVELAGEYHIVINYVSNEQAALDTLEQIRNNGGDGEVAKFDVANREETRAALKEIISRLDTVDVLVNNAGIARDGLFLMMPDDDWDSVVDTTLDGFFNVTKPVLKKMVRKKRGCIVSISSVAGMFGNRGQSNYAAAKAGLIGACKSLASEVARLGIRVNVVAPGLIETEMMDKAPVENIKAMIPMARVGKPEEVAKVVKFLCSDDASYIAGQVISVNGGMF